jgi:hypothetical protein
MRYRSDWISKDARDNATALRRHYREGFTAIAELDRLGHSLLHAAGSPHEPAVLEQIVGIALLRRAVSTFSSVRALLESALPDPARAPARALFEIWLNYRCLAYGAESDIALETRTERTSREPRAHRFFVASERRGLRSRAMVLLPDIRFRPSTVEQRDAIEKELAVELYRLRKHFPTEWRYFGDCPPDPAIVTQRVKADPHWFAAEWVDGSVTSIGQLAHAFGYEWEYDFIYDAFSALVHARGVRHDVEIEGRQAGIRHPNDDAWFCIVAYYAVHWQQSLLTTAAKWHHPETLRELQAMNIRYRDAIATLEPKELPPLLS